jgi:twitching motility protein PilT
MQLNEILDLSIELNASDINITEAMQLNMRINRDIKIFEGYDYQLLTSQVKDIMAELTESNNTIVKLFEPSEFDGSFVYYKADEQREYYYRYNIALTNKRIHITLRKLIDEVKSIEYNQLHLGNGKKFLDECIQMKEGLYLIVGGTGSGKSTTMTTIIDKQLNDYNIKTITLEDPIEYYYQNENYDNSVIIQREIGMDSASFADGLRAAMRQNPDVILVGEIRDPETALAALQAANTGHVVMATLHAKSPEMAQERIKFLVGSVTDDFSFIRAVMYQKLQKNREGNVEIKRNIYINPVNKYD